MKKKLNHNQMKMLEEKKKKRAKAIFEICPHVCVSGGGPACCHGEGETGTGGDESQAVVHPTLPGREGRSPDRPAGREAEAPGGGPGNEVRKQNRRFYVNRLDMSIKGHLTLMMSFKGPLSYPSSMVERASNFSVTHALIFYRCILF